MYRALAVAPAAMTPRPTSVEPLGFGDRAAELQVFVSPELQAAMFVLRVAL